MFDPYEIFRIDRNANQEMIKQRWKTLIQKWHPDKYDSLTDVEKEKSKEMFEKIQEANKILGDPDKRRLYDETGFIEPPETEISRSVESVLKVLVTNYLSQGDVIFTTDIIKEINKYCDMNIKGVNSKIKEFKKKREFLSKVGKKFRRKKKLNRDFLNHIFLSEFNSLDQAINGQITVLLVMNQVKSVINAYEFDFMSVIEGPVTTKKSVNKISLGNIFDLAGVIKNNVI